MSIAYKGLLVLICGPSGVGKGTVIRELKKDHPEYVYPLSCTTREIRPGEKKAEVYHFVSKEEFEKKLKNNEFLEYACVHKTEYYGTLKEMIIESLEAGKVVVRELDVQGFRSVRDKIPKENLLSIFLKAPTKEDLVRRILKRGRLSDDEMNRRIESAEREMAAIGEFDFQVWSLEGRIPKCVGEVESIINGRLKIMA